MLPYSSLIWVMTYLKTALHEVASQAAAGARLYFRCFPAYTKNNLAFAARQVVSNQFVTKATKLLLFSLVLIPYCTTKKDS